MGSTELQDIREYWMKKYPNVEIMLWKHDDSPKYHGRMNAMDGSTHFCADTIGELITEGEKFLRSIK